MICILFFMKQSSGSLGLRRVIYHSIAYLVNFYYSNCGFYRHYYLVLVINNESGQE
jgi:hypothetical protein